MTSFQQTSFYLKFLSSLAAPTHWEVWVVIIWLQNTNAPYGRREYIAPSLLLLLRKLQMIINVQQTSGDVHF